MKRQKNSVAVHVMPPDNWNKLLEKQEALFVLPSHKFSNCQKNTHPS